MLIESPKFAKGERVLTPMSNGFMWLSGVVISIRLYGTTWKYGVIVEDDKDRFGFTFNENELSKE